MKAFISYSVNDADQYILTLLSSELNKQGVALTQSSDFRLEMSSLTKVNIKKSNLFIGIITGLAEERDRVFREWQLARQSRIPTILLIEDNVQVNSDFKGEYISFNRLQPQSAMSDLKRIVKSMQEQVGNNPSAWPWILGGAALLSLFGILAARD